MNANADQSWIVAIDGGGSKISVAAHLMDAQLTNAHLATGQLSTAHAHRSINVPDRLDPARTWSFAGTGSAHPSTWTTARQNLEQALSTAVASLRETGQPLGLVLFALAGAGRPEDRARVCEWSTSSSLLSDVHRFDCVGDIEPIVDYCHDDKQHAALAVILGTGSIVAARTATGAIVRAGGWGPNLGDECSGGALGLAALRLVVAWFDAHIAIQQASPLVRRVIDRIAEGRQHPFSDGVVDRSDLSAAIIRTAADRTATARLAPLLLEAALEYGEAEARDVLNEHLDKLVTQIETVFKRAFERPSSFDIVIGGGLVAHAPKLQQALLAACNQRDLLVRHTIAADPLLAALRYAVRLASAAV